MFDSFTYDQSNILYDALALYLRNIEGYIDYRARYGLQIGTLQDHRAVAIEMRDEARSQAIRVRVARQDKVLQDKLSDV